MVVSEIVLNFAASNRNTTSMKLKKEKNGSEVKVTFIPETDEEKRIMGSLREHYFWGDDENGTYPQYGGITTDTDGNFVTSMSFNYKLFGSESNYQL